MIAHPHVVLFYKIGVVEAVEWECKNGMPLIYQPTLDFEFFELAKHTIYLLLTQVHRMDRTAVYLEPDPLKELVDSETDGSSQFF